LLNFVTQLTATFVTAALATLPLPFVTVQTCNGPTFGCEEIVTA
jgi:hypothetical protein